MDKHFIVLNGKRYDAVTGALLGTALDDRLASRAKSPSNPHLSRLQPSAKPVAHAPAPVSLKPRPSRDHHGAPKPAVQHRTEPAKTLMRRAVNKPAAPAKLPTTKRHYPVAQKSAGVGISPKLSVNTIDHHRLQRAQAMQKSQHVGKFSHAPTPIATKLKPLAVASAPARTPQVPNVIPAIAEATQEAAQKASDIFEQAIANATSHEQPKHKAKRSRRSPRRLASSLAALGAVFIVGGFLVYANKATVQLQVASVKAGFQASMPSYAPEGFTRQAATARDGSVAINFVSPLSNKNFSLTQESSDWDSQTLFDSLVATSNSSYQTVQSSGRTIYIYGNDQAAWVDGGILYKVSGNSGLTSDQIISLAASM